MANVPFPISGENIADLRRQIGELIRELYEERIGGASLGDVFAITGDILTLVLASSSGLSKTGSELSIDVTSDGGLQLASGGVSIKILSTGGLETTTSGLGINLDGNTLSLSASGLKLNTTVENMGPFDANKLVRTIAAETLESADANDFITGTVNEITVTDDGDGSVTLSGAGSDTNFTAITALQAGGIGAVGAQYKTRELTLNGGVITTVGAESGWNDI